MWVGWMGIWGEIWDRIEGGGMGFSLCLFEQTWLVRNDKNAGNYRPVQETSCTRNLREISKLMGIEILGFQTENWACQRGEISVLLLQDCWHKKTVLVWRWGAGQVLEKPSIQGWLESGIWRKSVSSQEIMWWWWYLRNLFLWLFKRPESGPKCTTCCCFNHSHKLTRLAVWEVNCWCW